MEHPNHHQHQPPHTPYGAQFFDELNAGLALSAQLRLPTQTDSSQGQQHSQPQQQQQTTPHNPRATDLASNHNIYLRPVPELPSEEEVHLNHDDLMEAVHAYGVRTGCDLVRHAQKTISKGQPPYRWMMLCSRAGNPPATTPTIRTNTKSKKTQCPFGFWCVALDRLNPLTSQYRIKLSDGHNQHNHAPATFAELPNAKRRARRAGIEPPAAVVLSRQGPLRPLKIELQMDFRVCVQVNPVIPLGAGPWGQRNVIGFQGGTFTAAWARGTVEPGGQDSQVVLPDSLHTSVSTNYLIRTLDEPPAFIAVRTEGWRTGSREVMERLNDPERAADVDPSEYSFKLSLKLETGDERYKDRVNTGLWVGSGAIKGNEVIYDAYRVV